MILAKRLTKLQKEEIIKLFISGISIDQLSKKFNCTNLTVSRNLKNSIGEIKYKEFLEERKLKNKFINKNKQKVNNLNNQGEIKIRENKKNSKKNLNKNLGENSAKVSEFIEIAPLNYDIENSMQKDFSSVPISDIDLPEVVFMIVDKKVELEIKSLEDYPEWQFLSQDELKRKTIEIYHDMKIAKSFCGKEQKVIKVPNTKVFKIVAPILLSRGISRIINSDKLIAL